MSEGNRDRFSAITRLWNAGDLEGVMERLDPAVAFSPDPRWPEPGPYVGREAVTHFLDEYRSAWGQVELRVEHVEERQGALIAQCRWLVQGASSGANVPVAFTLVLRFGADGLVQRMAAFFEHEQATTWVDATSSDG